ncbi:TRAF3-interacting protein 1 isoform X2 [Alosa pseudoharengus]|uniref:TRAF3-interacting protein 1 isoform X2 n=1 Tax=Alosa pseudoharengus TaxID=34774 RepID=UPI003F89B330
MNGAVVKKTQDTLGKVIRKPPLTEKLLNKPPFRYLHDILSEVIRTTGFLKGLYIESEMKSDNVKEKDSKIAFLQKAIDVVMLVSGEPLSVKPARIVAGHEPEKTNELLQAIGKCCLNKLNSDEAVKRVLSGEKVDLKSKPSSSSKSQDKENREGRDRHRDREERKEIKESSQSRAPKDPDQPREQEGRRPEKERHREGERSEKGRERDRTKERDRDKDKSRDRDKDRARDKDKERERERDREKERERDKEQEREVKARERGDVPKERERERRRERDRERERHKDAEEKARDRSERKVKAAEESRPKPHPEEPSKTRKPAPEESSQMPESESEEPTEVSENQSPARIPRPSSAKGQRRWPKAGGPDESDSEGAPAAERPVPLENGDTTDAGPPHAAHRRIPRPNSARPAPPRVKRQESYTEVAPAERLGSAKAAPGVIMEGKKLSEDEDEDDEQFVVEEAAPVPSDVSDMPVEASVELQGDENHGGLVKKILETKKDFETTPSSPKSNQERTLVSEAARRKERELVAREIERLRSSIQTVCRSALPLGKIMDYIQEDMDAMQNELQVWRRENKEHAQALLQEQKITDSAVEPLKAELSELEQLIRDQQDKICAVKSNILRNEEKIQKMVLSINFSSQT